MRKAFWPLLAAAVMTAVAVRWWLSANDGGYQWTGGPPLLFVSIRDLIASALLLLAAMAIVLRQLLEWKPSRR